MPAHRPLFVHVDASSYKSPEEALTDPNVEPDIIRDLFDAEIWNEDLLVQLEANVAWPLLIVENPDLLESVRKIRGFGAQSRCKL